MSHIALWFRACLVQRVLARRTTYEDYTNKADRTQALATFLFTTYPDAVFPRLPQPRAKTQPKMAAPIQIITDIDDTIKSSGGLRVGGIYLGGVDTSVTRSSFYPGVFQFGLELSTGPSLSGASPEPIAVLTARAEELKFFLEIKPTTKLCVRYREIGEACGLKNWGVGPVLYGSVQEWICQERKGWRKFENFKLLQARNPKKMQYVFIGDNGKSEKDLEAARMMIEAHPGVMRAIFIHAVSDDFQPAPLPADESFKGVPIYYYRTYATAARKAVQEGLISRLGFDRICDAIEADMARDPTNFDPGSANERLVTEEVLAAKESLRSGVFAQPIDEIFNWLRTIGKTQKS